MNISLTELEEAINYWRRQRPATGEECALSPEVNTLAGVYATMIFEGLTVIAPEALSARAQELVAIWQQQVA